PVVDACAVNSLLSQRKQLEDIGSAKYVGDLWDQGGTGANASYYAGLVRDAALLRRLKQEATVIVRHIEDGEGGRAEDVLQDAERRILAISHFGVTGRSVTVRET